MSPVDTRFVAPALDAWRSVFSVLAGVAIALATALCLAALWLAVGMTVHAGARAIDVASGIWTVGALVIGDFLGALCASLAARTTTLRGGLLGGLCVWSLATLLSALVVGGALVQAASPSAGTLWAAWLALALPLVASLCGGWAGIARTEAAHRRAVTLIPPTHPVPPPTPA